MKLQTEIPLNPEANQIDYSSKILLLGSCFSENIGGRFDYFKFRNIQNPFGVIFNPVSIEKLVVRAIDENPFSEKDIFQHNGIWKCFDAHSDLSSLDKNECLENLNSALKDLKEALFTSTHIIFTYGTSWVYRHIENDKIVANCYKLPQKNFQKELLSIEEILESLKNIFEKITAVNPKVSIITTVSPVRHIKDGFVENSQSKAHLISGIHNFINSKSSIVNRQSNSDSYRHVNQKSTYFPSYEIMMDELRDYRFYSEDMLHPNKTAIEIVWQKFSKVWVSSETETLQKEIASIQSGLLHKPFNPHSEEHLQFLKTLQFKIVSIQQKHPHIFF